MTGESPAQKRIGAVLAALLLCTVRASSANLDDGQVRRQEVFEFAQKPRVTREGDKVTIEFESKGYCDATVAVENAEGKIVRHLVSGVLGSKAPRPFQRNSLRQTVVWDGKDDKGEYIDDKDSLTVRVSLGLKAEYERNLMWCPKKRGPMLGTSLSGLPALVAAGPDGVYTFDGESTGEQVRLFDHNGNYVRTVYPWPAGAVKDVAGLRTLPVSDPPTPCPLKWDYDLRTMLTAGSNFYGGNWSGQEAVLHPPGEATIKSGYRLDGGGAMSPDPLSEALGGKGSVRILALATRGSRVALAGYRLNRLSADGTSGGLPFSGGTTAVETRNLDRETNRRIPIVATPPTSMAFSPDGKWLYLTGYIHVSHWGFSVVHGVTRMEYEKDEPAKLWLGSGMMEQKWGKEHGQFTFPTCVAVDAQGRVYVCDYMNDRIEIFDPDGKFLASLATPKPVKVEIDPRSGELWVFSWLIGNDFWIPIQKKAEAERRRPPLDVGVAPKLTRYGPFGDLKPVASYPLPLARDGLHGFSPMPRVAPGSMAAQFEAAVDFWAPEPTVWISSGRSDGQPYRTSWEANIRLFAVRKDRLELVRDFWDDVKKGDPQPRPPYHSRQRLYFNPGDEKLYVGEQWWPAVIHNKSIGEVIQLDPATGRGKVIPLPFDCEDMAFDTEGRAYLRTMTQIVRYDPSTWREVPFDYGDEAASVSWAGYRKAKNVSSLIQVRLTCTHGSSQDWGMWVSPKGHVVIAGDHWPVDATQTRRVEKDVATAGVAPYEPRIYPGRPGGAAVFVFDRHGKMLYEDALPGATFFEGIAMDKDDFLYIAHAGMPPVGGKFPPNVHGHACTLMKLKPGTKVISPGRAILPLSESARPSRPVDFLSWPHGGSPVWIEPRAEWMHGGVGIGGKPKCHCFPSSRFGFDLFARSFAAELDRYRITVLDTEGNIVLRVGRYGNADDGTPLVADKASPVARSIGGDEVSLVHPMYLATQTDRRLFVADIGNYRIFSVRLGYHAEEKVALKGIPDLREK